MRALCLVLAAASFALMPPASAQYRGPDPKASTERIKQLALMIGSWRGKGWMLTQGGRETFNSRETITSELDGTALMVRGIHSASADPARVVHNALGIIAWDQGAQRYSFRAYLATGANSEFTLGATGTGFEWSMDAGPAKIRYKATVTADSWTEDGERSMDQGKSWVPFFHMDLSREN